MNRCILLAAFVWVASGSEIGIAQDIQVNTYTTGGQRAPSIAMDTDGDFVVVWQSTEYGGPASGRVLGQLYESNGSPIGIEFQVNINTTDDQRDPAVAMDADGDFVVVWEDRISGGDQNVLGRRYASNGSPVGVEFLVNTYTTSLQNSAAVAMGAVGDFVVVWVSSGSGGTDPGVSVQGQRYASNGSPVGLAFQVNTYTTNFQTEPRVAMDSDGDFVIVWASVGSSGTDSLGTSVQLQRYASNGSPIGVEFQVNTYTTDHQTGPSVAMSPAGGFVVAWTSDGSSDTDSSGASVQLQHFDSNGSPVSGESQVNSTTTGGQSGPSVGMDADGNFAVVWHTNQADIGDIRGQRFAANGFPRGSEFQVNTYITGLQAVPKVAIDADGKGVVVWESDGSFGTPSSNRCIQRTPVGGIMVPVELMTFMIE